MMDRRTIDSVVVGNYNLYKFWQDSDWAEFGHSRHLDATNVGLRCRVIALTLGIGLPNW